MALRIILTVAAVLVAIGGFLGAGPTDGSPFNPFGWLFVGLAALIWFAWNPITGGLRSRTGVMDAFTRNMLGNFERKSGSGGSHS